MPRLNANACGMYGNMPADEKNVALLSRAVLPGSWAWSSWPCRWWAVIQFDQEAQGRLLAVTTLAYSSRYDTFKSHVIHKLVS